jgi:hypothetical protein
VGGFARPQEADWSIRLSAAVRKRLGGAVFRQHIGWHGQCTLPKVRLARKGEAIMLKNLIITLGIAALTSGSALAAAQAPKTTAHVTRKVAQAGEAKPAPAKSKIDKAGKKAKAEKRDVKSAETAATPAPAKK